MFLRREEIDAVRLIKRIYVEEKIGRGTPKRGGLM